jgi:hypothetical protein
MSLITTHDIYRLPAAQMYVRGQYKNKTKSETNNTSSCVDMYITKLSDILGCYDIWPLNSEREGHVKLLLMLDSLCTFPKISQRLTKLGFIETGGDQTSIFGKLQLKEFQHVIFDIVLKYR